MALQERYDLFERSILVKEAQRNAAITEKDRLQAELDSINLDLMKQSNIVLSKLSEKQRKIAAAKLEDLCTFALQYAISPDMIARIKMKPMNNKPTAQLYIYNTVTDVETIPISADGGGIVDIIATTLRFVLAEVWRDPPIDGPMILDEAYKHLSKEYTSLIAEFLKKLSDDFGRQIIMCTHNDFIAQSADLQIKVSLDDKRHSQIRYGA